MSDKIRNGLFIFLFIILLLPMAQHTVPFITSSPLNGFAENAADIDFSWSGWWDGSYRDKKARYLNDSAGFRADMVRFNNQLDYSLLGVLHSWKVVEGKDHYLFMDDYIDDYYGRDYMGYDSILQKMKKVKALSDTFARLGKSLILVYTPAKEFMYPEYFPEKFKSPPRAITNLQTYCRIGDSLRISQLDLNTWFCNMKNTSKELLYTKQGVHWSVYGSYLAADSMISYLEKLRNIRMPHPVWTTITHTNIPRETDDDIAKTLNLIYPITQETFSYPQVSFPEDKAMIKPKVIYIGDSFLLNWTSDGIMDHTNTDWQAWQWFSIVWDKNNAGGKSQRQVADTDWLASINNTDCIILMYTSFNLPYLGNGFIEKAYDHYFPGGGN